MLEIKNQPSLPNRNEMLAYLLQTAIGQYLAADARNGGQSTAFETLNCRVLAKAEIGAWKGKSDLLW